MSLLQLQNPRYEVEKNCLKTVLFNTFTFEWFFIQNEITQARFCPT